MVSSGKTRGHFIVRAVKLQALWAFRQNLLAADPVLEEGVEAGAKLVGHLFQKVLAAKGARFLKGLQESLARRTGSQMLLQSPAGLRGKLAVHVVAEESEDFPAARSGGTLRVAHRGIP
jgi:hypothetical protein